MTGENFFLIMPYCNTNHMNAFLRELSAAYPKDYILLVTDGAAWDFGESFSCSGEYQATSHPALHAGNEPH